MTPYDILGLGYTYEMGTVDLFLIKCSHFYLLGKRSIGIRLWVGLCFESRADKCGTYIAVLYCSFKTNYV